MWPVIIVLLVIAMLVGPIMIMQPSKAQKRLAALRMAAAKFGLHVGASSMKAPDGTPCWTYTLLLPEKNTHASVVLERKSYEHGLHIALFWAVKQGEVDSQLAPINTFLQELPRSVYRVEINEHAIGVHWTEQGGIAVLEAIATSLKSVAAQLNLHLKNRS